MANRHIRTLYNYDEDPPVPVVVDLREEREKLLRRWSELKQERATWVPHWQELSGYLLPRSGRFLSQDRNRGERKHGSIYDSTGTRALRILAAGMMAGMTSPARPWFRLETADKALNKQAAVRVWCSDVTELMLDIFAKSNTYRALHTTYEELGVYGTGAKIILDDFNSVIHHYPLTAGEYAVATDYRGNVNTLYREFDKTAAELVGEFGRENCSRAVQNAYDQGRLGSWFTVVHAIEPRADRDRSRRDSRHMPWRSTYFEISGDADRLLRDGGFKEFPALCSRWATSGGDIYGNGPGMEALGDIKQLQQEQFRKSQAIDFQTKPPLQGPPSLKNAGVEVLPGGITYVDQTTASGGIRPLYESRLDLSHLLMDIQDVRERVRGAFYADLFLMLSQQPVTGRMTATEVAERHEEKLLMLGPTVERLHNEELSPLIETTFARMVRAGILPPPPPELHGVDLNVNFVSMLAQAQRAITTNGIDRFVMNLGAIAAVKPDVLDKFDADEWADVYSDALGVDPTLIVADDKVALVRKSRAQAQQAIQQAAMANSAADTAQKLGNAPTTGGNALTDVTHAFAGYT